MTSPALFDPLGAFLPALCVHDLRDRWHGKTARANARWGWLTVMPPPGGRLIWIVCGAQRLSLRLGVELARSIHETRRDARVVLTFEQEHPDLLAPAAGLERAGFSYAPADHAGCIGRAWRRLAPLGVVLCAALPRRNLTAACNTLRHVVALDPPEESRWLRIERAYPSSEELAWAHDCAPAADFATLLTRTKGDAEFAGLINGGSQRHLWWWHGADVRAALRFIALFRGRFQDNVLFVSGLDTHALDLPAPGVIPISRWPRARVESGSVVLVDDSTWLPAVAACSTAAHLAGLERESLWQAMAGGAAVSCRDVAQLPGKNLAHSVRICADEEAVLTQWQGYRDDGIVARAHAEAAQGRFVTERKRAAEHAAELIRRIGEWKS